jgi:hypothetical protein
MSTASSFNAALTGRVEINRAIPVPVPGVPEATNVILVSELLGRLEATERRIVKLERRNESLSAEAAKHRRAVVKERPAHPLDRRNVSASVLHAEAGEDDLLSMSEPDLADESLRDAVAAARSDLARDVAAD